METFKLQIITPTKVFYIGDITMVEYNTTEGQVGVLASHIPMTQMIVPGKLSIYEANNENPKLGALHSGFVQIMPDVITIMAETIEWKEDIDINRAKEAKNRAEERLASLDSSVDIKRAEFALKKAITRIQVASY